MGITSFVSMGVSASFGGLPAFGSDGTMIQWAPDTLACPPNPAVFLNAVNALQATVARTLATSAQAQVALQAEVAAVDSTSVNAAQIAQFNVRLNAINGSLRSVQARLTAAARRIDAAAECGADVTAVTATQTSLGTQLSTQISTSTNLAAAISALGPGSAP